jgi:amino acid permease
MNVSLHFLSDVVGISPPESLLICLCLAIHHLLVVVFPICNFIIYLFIDLFVIIHVVSQNFIGVTILRRSSRLMHSKMAEASNNQQPTKRAKKSDKSEKKPYPFRVFFFIYSF